MHYFVTGGTGFIGRHLIELLLARGGIVYALVRKSSLDRLEALRGRWNVSSERLVPVVGDLERPMLGVSPEVLAELSDHIDHFFHVAALYNMSADARSIQSANVGGTWHAVQFCNATRVGCLHHVSSIAAAGHYSGTFREDMFEEATGLDDPYYRSKHDAERVVRNECQTPWRIYRPSVVVGHSQTGEMDKIDGPYYFFRPLQELGAALPSQLPLLGLDTGPLNIVPVDFVAKALDHIAHADNLDGHTFHLVDPQPKSATETMNVFAKIARAPHVVASVDVSRFRLGALGNFAGGLPMRAVGALLNQRYGIPPRLVTLAGTQPSFDCSETLAALEGSGIHVPPLEDYAERLWNYWEDNLDCDLRHSSALSRAVRGKRVLITGASAGIGRAAALKIGAAGANVLLVARTAERLEATKAAIEKAGGAAHVYAADLSSVEACEELARRVIDDHGGVDVLVNNAALSIRRSLKLESERFRDYERTMALNYFGAIKLILAFVPGMRERGDGLIVNVSSIGVQMGGPLFSAYLASKAALDAFSRSAASELLSSGVSISTVYMPLVRTAMSAPTSAFDSVYALTPPQAADLICDAIVRRPKRISNPMGLMTELAYMAAPGAVDTMQNVVYRLFPDSRAARGGIVSKEPGEPDSN